MRRLFIILVGATAVLAAAAPALAQSLEGGCTVMAESDIDTTDVLDATRSDPFEIDPEGSISWTALSPGPIQNHTWEVGLVIGGIRIAAADGGDANADGDTTSDGSRSIAELIDDAGVGILDDLAGVYRVYGSIEGEGGSCSGDGFIRIEGSAFGGLIGQIAGGSTILGLVLLVASAVKKGS